MRLNQERLAEIVGELSTKPGHDKVKAAIQELLVDGLAADRKHVSFEQPVPEAQGRIDAILGRTAFEVKSDLSRELGDAEEQLSRYLPEREQATRSRFVGIATDGLDWRAYEWRGGATASANITRPIGFRQRWCGERSTSRYRNGCSIPAAGRVHSCSTLYATILPPPPRQKPISTRALRRHAR
jgi:hypothetical protein